MKDNEKQKAMALAKMASLEDQVWKLIQEPQYFEILMELKEKEVKTDEDFVVMLCASLVYGTLVKKSLEDEDPEETISYEE